MGKSTFCICEKQKEQISCSSLQADQRLCFVFATVKFLNIRTPENFAAIYLNSKRQNLLIFPLKDANGIANSEDPDQIAPLGAV